MKLLTGIYNPRELDDFRCAMVTLDRQTAKLILHRRDILHGMQTGDPTGDLTAMEWYSYSAEFLSGVPKSLVAALAELDDTSDGLVVLQNRVRIPSRFISRIDYPQMRITNGGVLWTCIPHYADQSWPMETNSIDYSMVEEAAI